MLEQELRRVRRARSLDQIVVATTTNVTDDPIVALCNHLGVASFRGSEHDVLSRYEGAAAAYEADIVVRVTADCPLHDGGVIDEVIRARELAGSDYASNVLERTFPRGLDVEVLTREALSRCVGLGTSAAAREHVTWFIHSERPDLFSRTSFCGPADASDLRWTVDTPEDFAFVSAVYDGLELGEDSISYATILAWVRAHPEVISLNASIEQKKS
jgi:spore coat polysaccharide biosynthesis protein SpsF